MIMSSRIFLKFVRNDIIVHRMGISTGFPVMDCSPVILTGITMTGL